MGGLLGINNALMYKGNIGSDFNEMLDQGIYYISGNGINAPNNYAGIILVLKSKAQITQFFITNVNGTNVFIRTLQNGVVSGSEWFKWSVTSVL